ncbi:hypothetical protein ABIA13_003811 [Sinorhizobium fredii]
MPVELTPSKALGLWHAVALEQVRIDSRDLTLRQMAILLEIYLVPPPHTVRGLAARLGVTKPVITPAPSTRWVRSAWSTGCATSATGVMSSSNAPSKARFILKNSAI